MFTNEKSQAVMPGFSLCVYVIVYKYPNTLLCVVRRGCSAYSVSPDKSNCETKKSVNELALNSKSSLVSPSK